MTGVRDPSSINKFGDYAHVPGSGPKSFECRDCKFMTHWWNAQIFGRCEKAAEMRHTDVMNLRKIWLDSEACKYFQERPDGTRPWDGMMVEPVEIDQAGD